MDRLILVDADGLLYLAGAMGEKREYHAIFEDKDGVVADIFRDKAAEIKEFDEAHPDLTLIERELIVTPGPLEHCLQIAKGKLIDIQKRYKGNLEVYVKGDGTNFRDEIATLHKYKGNRTAPKPHYLEQLRQYLITTWDAIEVSGKEADDQIATRAYEASKPYVIVSPDKDLDQIPGLHWNYSKNVEYDITPDEAREFFWVQALAGDTADNIKGCWKLGVAGAQALVSDWIADQYTDEEIWAEVLSLYEASMEKPNCPYAGMPVEDVAIENARLVWMQTEAGRLWTPPGAPKEYLEVNLDD